jgi:DNA-directed RNA polymerase subunit RPC12/RpoP
MDGFKQEASEEKTSHQAEKKELLRVIESLKKEVDAARDDIEKPDILKRLVKDFNLGEYLLDNDSLDFTVESGVDNPKQNDVDMKEIDQVIDHNVVFSQELETENPVESSAVVTIERETENYDEEEEEEKEEDEDEEEGNNVTPAMYFVCQDCGKLFNRKSNWKRHQEVHNDRIYHCEFCSKNFNSSRALKSHLQTHGIGKVYVCRKCSQEFRTRSVMYNHKKMCN